MMDKQRFQLTPTEWQTFLASSDDEWMSFVDHSQVINAKKCGRFSRLFWRMRGRYYGFDWTTVEFPKDVADRYFFAVPLSVTQKMNDAIVIHDGHSWVEAVGG